MWPLPHPHLTGMFKAGKQHGKGRCVYADGSKYEGDWEDGQRSGKGVCIYANGDKFQGEWRRGRWS